MKMPSMFSKFLFEEKYAGNTGENGRCRYYQGAVSRRLGELDAVCLKYKVNSWLADCKSDEPPPVFFVNLDFLLEDKIHQEQENSRNQRPYANDILNRYILPYQLVRPKIRHSPKYYGDYGDCVNYDLRFIEIFHNGCKNNQIRPILNVFRPEN